MNRNKEGLTWREWYNAARPRGIAIIGAATTHKMRKAWKEGQDPSEWRASFSERNINGLIEQLRDIYCGRDTYDSEREWLDNMNAAMRDLCDGVGIDFRPQ